MPLERILIFLAIGIGASSGLILPAFAVSCLDLGNCPVSSNPLEWMIFPFTYMIGDWIFVLMWGMVAGVMYVRTHSLMVVVLSGFLMFAGFIGTSTYTGSSTSQVFYWGFVLMAVSIGMVVFYLLWVKVRSP